MEDDNASISVEYVVAANWRTRLLAEGWHLTQRHWHVTSCDLLWRNAEQHGARLFVEEIKMNGVILGATGHYRNVTLSVNQQAQEHEVYASVKRLEQLLKDSPSMMVFHDTFLELCKR